MEHLDLAPEALQAFSVYAQKMEQLPETNDVLVLRIHKDGSGCICASRWHRIEYIGFNDLADLLQQLKALETKRERQAALAEIANIANQEGMYD